MTTKKTFWIICSRLALFLSILMIDEYSYFAIMKEHRILAMTLSIFLPLFLGGALFADIIYRFKKASSKFLSAVVVLWGITLCLIPFLSVENFLMMRPITKLNTFSLYLMYTLAGVCGLSGLFAGAALRLMGRMELMKGRQKDLLEIGSIAAAFLLSAFIPGKLSYEFIYYALGAGLFLCAYQIETEDQNIAGISAKVDLPGEGIRGLFILSYVLAMLIMPLYLQQNLQISTLNTGLLLAAGFIMTLPLFKVRGTMKVKMFLSAILFFISLLIPVFFENVYLLGLSIILSSSALAFLVTGSMKMGGTSSFSFYMTFFIPLALGLAMTPLIREHFGELVQYTNARYHYIPPVHHFYFALVPAGAGLLFQSIQLVKPKAI